MPHPLLQTFQSVSSPSVPHLSLRNYSRSRLFGPSDANTSLSDKISSTDRLLWQIHKIIKTSVETLKRNMVDPAFRHEYADPQSAFIQSCLRKPDTYKQASLGLTDLCLDDIRALALGSPNTAEVETIEKGLDLMARDFSPIPVDVSANERVNDSVHPLAGKLFTEGAAHIQTLHLALKTIEKTIENSAQRNAYLKQLGTIIQDCAIYYAQDACVHGKLSELQRAAMRAQQLLSNDVLKSMLRKQFTDILINVTQSTLVNSDTNPITNIINQQRKELNKTITDYAPQHAVDFEQVRHMIHELELRAKETREWFVKSVRGNVVHRVNALIGSLKTELPIEETNIVDGYAEDLTTSVTPRTKWINTAYRRLLNQHLVSLDGALHPLTVINALTDEIIQNLKDATPDITDSRFYPELQSALASLEPALGEIDVKLVIDMDPMEGTCHWNENLHQNLSNLITQTAWENGLIHPDFTVAIRPDNRIIAFDRDKILIYGSHRVISQTHPVGLLVFTDRLKNTVPKLIKFGGDDAENQATDAPTQSTREELALESALTLCFKNPLEHDGGEILKRLNIAAHAADEQTRNALYGDKQKLINNLSNLFERHLHKPEDLKKSALSDLTQKLFQKEHHELLSTLLKQSRKYTWGKLLERALSDAALTDQYPGLDKTAIQRFLISYGKHILDLKAFIFTQHHTMPQFNLDALLSAENADFLESLLDAGIINPDLRTDKIDSSLSNGKTLLIHAIKHGSPRSIELLCGYGASARDRSFTSRFSGQEKTLLAAFGKHAHRFSETDFISRCMFTWLQKRSNPSVTATLRT